MFGVPKLGKTLKPSRALLTFTFSDGFRAGGGSACGPCLSPEFLLLGLYLCCRSKELGQYPESGFFVPRDLGERPPPPTRQGSGKGESKVGSWFPLVVSVSTASSCLRRAQESSTKVEFGTESFPEPPQSIACAWPLFAAHTFSLLGGGETCGEEERDRIESGMGSVGVSRTGYHDILPRVEVGHHGVLPEDTHLLLKERISWVVSLADTLGTTLTMLVTVGRER